MPALQPIDDYVFKGFQQQYQQTFGCMCTYTNVHEKSKLIERLFDGKEVRYPWAYFVLQNVTPNTESYNPHYLGRRGLPVTLDTDGGGLLTARLLPVNFEIEISYITNKFQSRDQGSVLSYMRRWMMARRFGYLKFDISYGRLSPIGIGVTLADSVPMPTRENVVEQETAYTCTATATIHGYISEPETGHQGVIQELDTIQFVSGPGFLPFNRST